MRIWVDLTNSPHVLVMRPVIEKLRERGHEVEVTARDLRPDARAVRAARHRAHGDRAPPRWPDRRQGARAGRAVATRSPGGRVGGASTARSATAPTTSRSPPRCCASRPRPRSTTSGRPSSTTSTAGWPPRWSSPTRSRPSACTALARGASCDAYPGLKEEYYLADFEPDPSILGRAWARPGPPGGGGAHAARGLALSPVRERPVRRRAPPAGRRADGRAAADSRATRRA